MATLSGNTIASTFGLLLKIDSTGLDGTLREVEDGDATASPLYLSTADVAVKDGSGLIVGSTTIQETISIGDGATDLVPEVQVLGTGQADATLMLASFSATATSAGAPMLALVKSGDAAIDGTHAIVTDGEELGNIIAFGDDGVDLEAPAAMIQFEVDGAPGAGDMPGRIIFATTTDGGETLAERVRISAAGLVTVTGNIVPESDGTRDLGSASLQWQNVYTEDLNLNNTGRDGNEVDGTTGHWVIQEGDENLFLLNRGTGKQYKFSLEEIV